jgi:hypothetical protein
MSSKEILEKAIQKAIDGGWPTILASSMVEWNVYDDPINGRLGIAHKLADRLVGVWSFAEVIYDPSFAKALRGDESFTTTGLKCSRHPGVNRYWQYHLRQMVIADDPIKYLGENI